MIRPLFNLFVFVGINFSVLGQFDLDSLINMTKSPVDTVKIDGLNELCWYFKYSNPDTALFLGGKALELSESIDYKFGSAKAYNNIAIVYWGKSDYDSAIIMIDKAGVIYEDIGLQKGICSVLINKGILKQNTGDLAGSLKDLFAALRIQEEENLTPYLGPILTNVGNTYFYQSDFINAKKWYLKAYYEKIKNGSSSMFITEMNLGVSYQKTGMPDSALLLYEKAKVGAREAKAWKQLQEILMNIGTVYTESGDLEKAIVVYEESKELLIENGNRFDKTILLARLAETYRLLGEYEESIENAKQSLELAKEVGNHGRIQAAYHELYESARAIRDFEKSLFYYQQEMKHKDSVFSVEKERELAEIVTEYEVEKKDQEIKILASEAQFQQLKASNSRMIAFAIAIIALLVVGAILLINSRRRYKLKVALSHEKERIQRNRFKAVIEAEEKERKRIAQELHDGLGQLLSTARLSVSSLDEEEKNDQLNHSLKMIDLAVEETRSISHNLMPNALTSNGLKEALIDMVRKINKAGDLKFSIDVEALPNYHETQSISIYRMVQEVVNNMLKYAEASHIDLKATSVNEAVLLEIRDNGRGFDLDLLEKSEGIGWKNIQSRLSLLGGDLSVISKPGEGTNVKINLPSYESSQNIAG